MLNDLIQVDPTLLAKWNRSVPRYTSYPTAPQFHTIEPSVYQNHLHAFDHSQKPLSLYIHIPFCKTMCLFCGCSVILNRQPEKQTTYLRHLFKEIALTATRFSTRRRVTQLHFGGGTPTSLSEEEFEPLMELLHRHFIIEPDAEVSIEIDPRTVYADQGHKLKCLKKLGFNRVSFGVQDLDPLVQEAIKRRQTEEMTVSTYQMAREIGFDGINIDLIYGLPHQTVARFNRTADRLIQLKPDRIAFYSYAQIPWLKPHQKAIPAEALPSTEEKFSIYVEARARFMQNGYTAIGMDHFSLPTDPLTLAYQNKTLTRNFQGYSVQLAEDMIGFGVTSIGFLENGYFQNVKPLYIYQEALKNNHLPIDKGYILTADDTLRRQAIQSFMCHFELPKIPFGHLANLEPLKQQGFLEETEEKWIATPLGRLFIRLIASAFDVYLQKGQFSKAV